MPAESMFMINSSAPLVRMDKCEGQRQNSWPTNTPGAESTGLLANELDGAQDSTCMVCIFDGRQEFFTDFHNLDFTFHYAESKLCGMSISNGMR